MKIRVSPRVAGLFVFLSVAIGATALRADEIDRLFSQFNYQIDAKNYREAESTAKQMLSYSFTDGWKAASYNCLGRAYRGQERYHEAIEAYRQALTFPLEPDNVNLGWIPNNLGLAYRKQKKYDDAERYLTQARTVFERMKGPSSREVGSVCSNLGELYIDTGRHDEAEPLVSRALAIGEAVYGPEHSSVAHRVCLLGRIEYARKRYQQAESYFKRALALHEKLCPPEHPDVACEVSKLAAVWRDQKRFSEAEAFDRRSLRINERVYGMNHEETADDLEHLAADLEGLGRTAEAPPLRERAKQIRAAKASPEASLPVKITAVVSAETATVHDAGQAIGTISRGQQYEVFAIRGPWCAIEIEVAGKRMSGWVRDVDLISAPTQGTPAVAIAAQTASTAPRWTQLKPAAAKAMIEFPGSPKAETQVVNEVTNYAYTLEAAAGTFVFSYFDIPLGKMLTFDAARDAYAKSRKGTVESEKTVIIEEYPGKEYLVRLADKRVSRLRLLAISRRWYQLFVEGDASFVQGAEANRFIQSFKLVE